MNTVTAQICHTCGTRLLPNDRFCSGCGARAVGNSTPAPGLRSDALLARLRTATLGLYDVHSELGRGGMAAVYLAHDLLLQRKVAIKVMLPELFMSDGMADRFLLEARTAARLSHPNIVVIHWVSNAEDLFYFVMSLVEGAAVDEIAKSDAPLRSDEAQWILTQAARALQYAHLEGVVHRDVKPANIMVNVRGDVILTDFGIAKATESPQLTRTGSTVGTPAYMSPEQVLATASTGASDQYSLGIVAYELFAGSPPFRGSSLEVQWAHAHRLPTDLASVAPHVPASVTAAVMRMLHKDPKKRWKSLEPVVDVFANGLAASGGSARQSLADRARDAHLSCNALLSPTPHSPLPGVSRKLSPLIERAASGSTPATTPPSVTPATQATVKHSGATPVRAEPPQELLVGQTVSLGIDSALVEGDVSYASSDPAVLNVDSGGVARALAAGTATVIVAMGDSRTQVRFAITAPPARATHLVITPNLVELEVGDAVPLKATPYNDDGTISFANSEPIIWQSDEEAVATCDAEGLLRTHSRGYVAISAHADGLRGACEVVVVLPTVARIAVRESALTLQLHEARDLAVYAFDRRGALLPDALLEFTISDPRILAIDLDESTITARAVGSSVVVIRAGAVQTTLSVHVRPLLVAELRVRSTTMALEVGDTTSVPVSTYDADGVELTEQALAWESSDPGVIRASSDGLITALAPGRAIVTITCGAVRQPIDFAVAATPLGDLTITPADVSLVTGRGVKLTLQANDIRGRSVPTVSASWNTQHPSIATVTNGEVLAHAVGTTTITARLGVRTASVRVAVSAPVPAEIRFNAYTPTLRIGQHGRVTADARDAQGEVIAAVPLQWESSAPQIVVIDASGRMTALTEGSATITARTGTITRASSITVKPPRSVSVKLLSGVGVMVVVGFVAAALLMRDDAATLNTKNGDAATTTLATPQLPEAPSAPAVTPDSSDGSVAFSSIVLRIDNATAPSALTLKVGQSLPVSARAIGVGRDSALTVESSKPWVLALDRNGRQLRAADTGIVEMIARVGALEKRVRVSVVPVETNISSVAQVPASVQAAVDPNSPRVTPPVSPPMAPPVSPQLRTEDPPRPVVVQQPGERPTGTDPVRPATVSTPQRPRELTPGEIEQRLGLSWLTEFRENPTEFARRLTPFNERIARALKQDPRQFEKDGGFRIQRVVDVQGSSGRVEITFPSYSPIGAPLINTITIDVTFDGRLVSSAKLISGPTQRRK